MSGGRFCILGGGAWGTALALTARRAGHAVRLWARDAATVDAINTDRANPRYLPGVTIDEGVRATTDAAEALAGAGEVLAVVPAQTLRGVLATIGPDMPAGATLVLCAKGIERGTGRLMTEVVAEALPEVATAVLSGPSFATDVARGLPTAVVVASAERERAVRLARLLSTPAFRCYSTDDVVGVEIGGALKNVLAIAAGTVSGAGLGASAQAAMVTRGFVELRRMAAAYGARPETVMGLSGFGDLMLSCSSAQSRNFAYGLTLGRGGPLAGLPLAEGVPTAEIAASIADGRGIEAPIIHAVHDLLGGRTTVREAVAALMSRPLRDEDE
ncbi:MAG: NAD(P)-dependent glycerol-3-phosphate dehydrogenase [Bauldia sp.]|nr:MAG: NAD(P)-dependent glycerol-3-phosphate dehydrogenase [Bauldia sp.]CAG1013810.1 glycerol-3-phosphate dehydrogenase (NAD(P)+) [Rhizobiaceae bacterium]